MHSYRWIEHAGDRDHPEGGREVTVHYNDDFSGDATIRVRPSPGAPGSESVELPARVLEALAAHIVVGRRVERLEQASVDDVLGGYV